MNLRPILALFFLCLASIATAQNVTVQQNSTTKAFITDVRVGTGRTITYQGQQIIVWTTMPAEAVNVALAGNYYTTTDPTKTFTYSNMTPTDGTSTQLRMRAAGADLTVTIPSTYSLTRGGNITSLLVASGTTLQVRLQYVTTPSARWEILGDPPLTTGTGAYVLATAPTLTGPLTVTGAVNASGNVQGNTLQSTTYIYVGATSGLVFGSLSEIKASADGIIELFNNGETGFTRLNFGGTGSGFPSIQRTSTTLRIGTADGGTSAGDLIVSGAIRSSRLQLSAALGTDDTYDASAQIAGLNAGATIAQWEIVYLGGSSTWLLADANGTGTYPACGMAVAAYSSTNPAVVITRGTVRNDAWNWTPGGRLYLSATPGGLTQTAPVTSGDKVQDVGYALTADIADLNFNGVYVTVQ